MGVWGHGGLEVRHAALLRKETHIIRRGLHTWPIRGFRSGGHPRHGNQQIYITVP